ncbi:HAD family hydrolase [Extensimonas vulgaris]|uniref:phosphoglycolate phosphatase n=1 Tax=Extensimonas vulgaris TaxID=1031594 RepID=A0A369ALK7_9BURK|nr:HAD-IA family hydrolase [Extensimonas vulgaris]RCX10269.1 phosphoglycolate phosphatase [Extensimonas vulgaris]TWI39867.1 phosphoglycolate phosphatase [Extensimonas vulgaris]TXD17411.1 HAD-IA family hydrolase [Extensimonas vulgaris]
MSATTPVPAAERPRRFDLIAFDWDGTLFDSTAIIVRCLQEAVRDVGGKVPAQQDAAYVIGMGLPEALAHLVPDLPPAAYPELNRRYRYHYVRHQHDISLFDGVRPMLEQLRARGHWLAVATGKSRRGLDEALQAAGLHALFDATRTADETAGKPHPLMLHELMAELGAAPERVLMVGDTTHDLQMAQNAGCAGVGVAYGAHDPQAFATLQPLYVAPSVAHLHDWLLQSA